MQWWNASNGTCLSTKVIHFLSSSCTHFSSIPFVPLSPLPIYSVFLSQPVCPSYRHFSISSFFPSSLPNSQCNYAQTTNFRLSHLVPSFIVWPIITYNTDDRNWIVRQSFVKFVSSRHKKSRSLKLNTCISPPINISLLFPELIGSVLTVRTAENTHTHTHTHTLSLSLFTTQSDIRTNHYVYIHHMLVFGY